MAVLNRQDACARRRLATGALALTLAAALTWIPARSRAMEWLRAAPARVPTITFRTSSDAPAQNVAVDLVALLPRIPAAIPAPARDRIRSPRDLQTPRRPRHHRDSPRAPPPAIA